MTSPPRYLPARELPAYAYVPGEHPHPIRDPDGHAHGRAPEPLDTAFWWGVDLYNHGYLWEAHEAWEPLWQAAPRESAERALVQGLIQCAAACLKLRCAQPEGARRLAARGLRHLAHAIEGRADARGLDLPAFRRRFAAWIGTAPEHADARPRLELG